MLQRMIDAPKRFGWGECMLAHMFFEMHEVVYHEWKSIATGIMFYRCGHGTTCQLHVSFLRMLRRLESPIYADTEDTLPKRIWVRQIIGGPA
jgi:hypothetical protein